MIKMILWAIIYIIVITMESDEYKIGLLNEYQVTGRSAVL